MEAAAEGGEPMLHFAGDATGWHDARARSNGEVRIKTYRSKYSKFRTDAFRSVAHGGNAAQVTILAKRVVMRLVFTFARRRTKQDIERVLYMIDMNYRYVLMSYKEYTIYRLG